MVGVSFVPDFCLHQLIQLRLLSVTYLLLFEYLVYPYDGAGR
jgi:hypothetical protein